MDPAAAAAQSARKRLSVDNRQFVVVAHRGCHNAAPVHGLPATPENSLAGLENCIRLGVDMAEVDVRRTSDGELVMLHDETLDRTTTGQGYVSATSLAKLRTLRLRDNLGGRNVAQTEHGIPTLGEMLRAAHGRILLNLDIKDGIYTEVVDAVRRAGMQDQVVVKNVAGPTTPALAGLAPYDLVPFGVILTNADTSADLPAILSRQINGAKPVAIELPSMRPEQLPAVTAMAKRGRVPLWVNTLWSGFIQGWGGDKAALRDPQAVWGRMAEAGITIFQTDEPEALLAWRASRVAQQKEARQ
ncbi:glycerophosphodiester phosphodiesterase family protein [Sphingomonas endolithica]|uniref:glycerophosphodiester phosphodiesterase family protein n=1 Tax=Sphingomonas endolithica TaxID=2972485 RepID=UPI0021AEF5D8|nr:glycerophosphodiester phosphodiesterase family protein [Sphingomonas sp. ZFBP2030]